MGGTLTTCSLLACWGWWGSTLLGPEGISIRQVVVGGPWWYVLWRGCGPTGWLAARCVLVVGVRCMVMVASFVL
jgi:hypothetical protein